MKSKLFRSPLACLSVIIGVLSLHACAQDGTLVSGAVSNVGQTKNTNALTPSLAPVKRVLLISIDGMHQQDLNVFVKSHPDSSLSQLSSSGVTYQQAFTPGMSDSFPGLAAMLTGGTAKSHGFFYDESYDATLYPAGSNCQGPLGAEVDWTDFMNQGFDEKVGFVQVPGNTDGKHPFAPLDLTKLPLRKLENGNCTVVYPHDYLRVNTIFEVIKQSTGARTAWSDKHTVYEWVNGPSGKGVDDLFVPEIKAEAVAGSGAAYEAVLSTTLIYDDIKVGAMLNQIGGLDSSGIHKVGVPVIMGLNFQALSVAQKAASPGGGYLDAAATPDTQVATAMLHTDASLGKMIAALKAQNLFSSTMIVVSSKHGQSPIDRRKVQHVGHFSALPAFASFKEDIALIVDDSTAMIWMKNHGKAAALAATIKANPDAFFAQDVLSGEAMTALYGDPAMGRTPDIIVQPKSGVIYTKKGKKIAEHGGNSADDAHIALLVSAPGLVAKNVHTMVNLTQVAPTVLQALGISPLTLQAVAAEGTLVLPQLGL
ncbi:hypothetical protein HC248_01540 [Polaromonas vacuolata]|uniref:Uncharacterized protein n=1 Tax=Polaromonas vacuolata TaxID=37448 RepID=A0A6H2H8P1_9BURK|nr:alkaline phosphatase family protein [Polaromonas vacuolata]QJC56238.1 hypothetical protein HC248_01540 [Polaromonas vacuolata]